MAIQAIQIGGPGGGIQLPKIEVPRPTTIATGAPAQRKRPGSAINLNDDDLVRLTNRKGRLLTKLGDDAIANLPYEKLVAQHGPDFYQVERQFPQGTDFRHATGQIRLDNVMDFLDLINGKHGPVDEYGAFTQQVNPQDTVQVVMTPDLLKKPGEKTVSDEEMIARMQKQLVMLNSEGQQVEAQFEEEMYVMLRRVISRMTLDYFILTATANALGIGHKVVDIHTRLIPQAVEQVEKLIRYRAGTHAKR